MNATPTHQDNEPRPFVLAQLSDPHIGADWLDTDPRDAFRAAIAAVRELPDPAQLVLVSGDLSEHADDDEYAFVRETLATLATPCVVLPGNHDDPDKLFEHFELAADCVADGPLRLLALDSTKPGEDGGGLTAEQLDWLDSELAAAPGHVTLLALHHPPFATGIPPADDMGLDDASRRALAALLERHPQVRRIAAGHVHRAIAAEFAGRPAIAAPSTYAQLRLDLHTPELAIVSEPPGFAVHTVVEGELVSHFQPVT